MVEGAKYMVIEEDLTLGGGHTVQYTDHVSQKCTPEDYIIVLPNATPINLKYFLVCGENTRFFVLPDFKYKIQY